MRSYPDMNDEYDVKELKDLNAEDWMIECLKKNPEYVYWGNNEDSMTSSGTWSSPVEIENIKDLWDLDELNELVNFYFRTYRNSKECDNCESGYNKKTEEISKNYYAFEETGKRWSSKLTEDEIEALSKYRSISIDEARRRSISHGIPGCDALDRMLLIKTRAIRLGVWGLCDKCKGSHTIYTEPKARLSLQMWFIHPRKGASRGVLLKNINKSELDSVIEYLKQARERNYSRFGKL